MGVYQRPPRSDELYHWGRGSVSSNHKYIAKIGNRYFYTPEELKAFKQGVSGAGQRVSDNFSKLRQRAYDAAGGAAKRRAQASAQRANVMKNNVATAHDKAKYDALAVKQAKDIKWAQDRVMYKGSSRASVPIYDEYAQEHAKKYGHSDNHHNTSMARVTYTKSNKSPSSATEKARTQARTNKIINEFENDYKKSKEDERVTRVAAENAQAQADRDRNAYNKTLMGRAEAAGRKLNRAKREVSDVFNLPSRVENALGYDKRERVRELEKKVDQGQRARDYQKKKLDEYETKQKEHRDDAIKYGKRAVLNDERLADRYDKKAKEWENKEQARIIDKNGSSTNEKNYLRTKEAKKKNPHIGISTSREQNLADTNKALSDMYKKQAEKNHRRNDAHWDLSDAYRNKRDAVLQSYSNTNKKLNENKSNLYDARDEYDKTALGKAEKLTNKGREYLEKLRKKKRK